MANTPLLKLQNIGKIYVSDNNVSVGIRGASLAFERGEFVAVTGKSGSGKSTLLNVISGMDTYEEGELFIEGEPTSHYVQKDWEEYRKQYISFIFQDYNIIESFTVLQNVELALMTIEDPRARREKALELLRRVGLEKHIHHKGSKLSGGQKQRTVIARALAKDSPIILADEPTGNLDSRSSRDIIELLREVSRDKLVIVVTHSFEEVEACATRHIRVFDGAVELDQSIRPAASVAPAAPKPVTPPTTKKAAHTLRNGLHLGRVRFGATPKLSVFLCLLMTLTSLAFTLMTALSYDARGLFDDQRMFTHVDGRAVIVRKDGAVITDAELETLAREIGAKDSMHYDFMLDRTTYVFLHDGDWNGVGYDFSFGYPATSVTLDAGRYPERDDEVVLEVPISVKTYLGDSFRETEFPLLFNMATYRVVGVRYYYDNTRTPRMLFTERGYELASAIAFFSEQYSNFAYDLTVTDEANQWQDMVQFNIDTYIDFGMQADAYYLNISYLRKIQEQSTAPLDISTTLVGNFYRQPTYSGDYSGGGIVYEEEIKHYEEAIYYPLNAADRVDTVSPAFREDLSEFYYEPWQEGVGIPTSDFAVLSPDLFYDFMYENYYQKNYTQASLFFESDREAHTRVDDLRARGYIAVPSDATVEPDALTLITQKLGYLFDAIGWVISIVFATMFLRLCSTRAMEATRGDIGIMRSMGIPTGVVRVSIYAQTLLALIPAFLVTAVTCVVLYTTPKTNYIFGFLHAREYIILAAVLIAIALNLSRKNAARMFGESVKKTLRKGGSKA